MFKSEDTVRAHRMARGIAPACNTYRDYTAKFIQIWGGVGFCIEYDIQLFFRRAKQLQQVRRSPRRTARQAARRAAPRLLELRDQNRGEAARLGAGLAAAFAAAELDEARQLAAQLQYVQRVADEISEQLPHE